MNHVGHQMELTSLLNYFPSWSEQEFNQVFRQEIKREIIHLLQINSSMTDREISSEFGFQDPNKVRPRRNELVKDGILEEDCKRLCGIGHKLSIAWRLNREKLSAYIKER
jgi:hypothetical protein